MEMLTVLFKGHKSLKYFFYFSGTAISLFLCASELAKTGGCARRTRPKAEEI